MAEPESNRGSTSKGDDDDPPPLSIKLPKRSDLPRKLKPWSDVKLPVDILLLTVDDCEFLACYYYLRNNCFKSYHRFLGYVYFGNMGDEVGLQVALVKCSSGSRTVVRNAVTHLRPKATFFVGFCNGLNHKKTKLGDVVVPSKLVTDAYRTLVSRDIGYLVMHTADGWKPPLESPEVREVSVHCNGMILSCADRVTAEHQHKLHPEAIAVEIGKGILEVTYDMKLELAVVKGVSDFAFSSRSTHESWKTFASVMAASLVSNMLSDPYIFKQWPHYEGGVKTPQEILARGPLAVKIYNKALKEGKTNVRRLPIMLIGQARMGKTSLKKSLKGDLFDAEEKSTIGVELDPSYFEMTTEIWRPGKLDETTYFDSSISFEHQAARLIKSEGLKDIEETFQATSKEPTQTTDTSQQHHEPSTSRDTHVTTREVTNTKQEQPLIELDMANEEQEQSLIEHDMPDDVANLILTKSTFEDIKIDEVEKIYSIVWDFGGQSVYYVTHPLFLTTRAIYMLVYDLSRCPNDPAIPVRKQGLYGTLEDSYSVKTNLDYLDSWMSSVASLVSDDDGDDDEVPASHQTEKLPSKLPPVFLVCTHADKPYCGRDSATLAAEIFNSLQRKPYSSHLIDGVFAVDNSKSGSEPKCPGVVHLRNEIRTVAEELPFMKEEIPLKWLKFEKELQVKIKEGYKWISLENAKQVAFEMCHISEEEEFTTLMTFLHDQRIVIHFDETPILNKMVVLDIQWLINVFKKVIAIEPYGGGGKQYKAQWFKLMNTGILDEKLLEHVWGSLYDDKGTFESLIEIMEKFSLLCIWRSSDESRQYLVPSMLRSHPPEDIIQLVASSQIPSLYLTFNSSQVPIGLFPRMVLQFYQWCSKEWPSPCKPQLYHNFAKFFVCPDGGCSVVLLCHSSFIKIVAVHRANEVCDISPDARAIRRQVGLMLECMRKDFVWLKNMKCEMKVLCPVCCPGGSLHYCRDHDTKGCKQEECLHFWSETNLQCAQPFVTCDRSAVSKEPRLSIKQFAVWFAFLDEQQQDIDDCAARELPSIKEDDTSTIASMRGLPLSHSRDAKRMKLVSSDVAGTSDSSSASTENGKTSNEFQVKQGKPDKDELEGLASQLTEVWKVLGRRLEVDEARLDAFHRSRQDDQFSEKAYKMLLYWKQRDGSAATYQVLYDALCHSYVNRKDLAEKYCCDR